MPERPHRARRTERHVAHIDRGDDRQRIRHARGDVQRAGPVAGHDDATAPPPSSAPAPAATPCARVTAQELQQVATASHASSGPILLGEPQCKQFWAMAWAVRTAVAPQPAGYLFQVTAEGNWRYLAVGTAIDCTSRYGVPADVASALRGCR